MLAFLEQPTTAPSLLNSIGPGPEHSALLPGLARTAVAPSLAEDSEPSLTLAEPHSPSAPLSSTRTISRRLMTRPALPAIIMSTLS